MIILSEMSEPSSGVRLSQPQVVAYFDGESAGEGRLCVAERFVELFAADPIYVRSEMCQFCFPSYSVALAASVFRVFSGAVLLFTTKVLPLKF